MAHQTSSSSIQADELDDGSSQTSAVDSKTPAQTLITNLLTWAPRLSHLDAENIVKGLTSMYNIPALTSVSTNDVNQGNPFAWSIEYRAIPRRGNEESGVALIDPFSPENILSREFGELHYSNLDFSNAFPIAQTLRGGNIEVIGPYSARWWVRGTSKGSNKEVFPSKYLTSEFYIMKDKANFDVIIGIQDIMSHCLLIPNAPLPYIATHHRWYISGLPSIRKDSTQDEQAAVDAKRLQDSQDMKRKEAEKAQARAQTQTQARP